MLIWWTVLNLEWWFVFKGKQRKERKKENKWKEKRQKELINIFISSFNLVIFWSDLFQGSLQWHKHFRLWFLLGQPAPLSGNQTLHFIKLMITWHVVLVRPFISPRRERKQQIKLSCHLKSADRPHLLAASSTLQQHDLAVLIEILMTCLF